MDQGLGGGYDRPYGVRSGGMGQPTEREERQIDEAQPVADTAIQGEEGHIVEDAGQTHDLDESSPEDGEQGGG